MAQTQAAGPLRLTFALLLTQGDQREPEVRRRSVDCGGLFTPQAYRSDPPVAQPLRARDHGDMADQPATIAQMFLETVDRYRDQPALGVIEQGELRWLTWRQMSQAVDAERARLERESVGPGTPVTHPPENSLAWIARDLATHTLGAISTPQPPPHSTLPFPSSTVALVKTSGTTASATGAASGAGRWVALSAGNLASNTIAVADTIAHSLGKENDRDEIRLSFLPFSHLYARVCDLYTWIYRGSRLVLAESRETIFRDCQIARPTAINGVPYFYAKLLDRLTARREAGEQTTLRELLGEDIKRCYSGGAPLAATLQRAFAEEGLPLMSGYGLSESSPVVTVSTIRENRPGAVGKPLPGVEIRIAADGELLVRGPNVMLGYAGDEVATRAAIREGWLHTGDLGKMDNDGFLTIVGRKKEMIALSTGKKVSPSAIEARLTASPWIEQVAVVGEGRSCLGAIIVPNPDRLRSEIRRRRLWVWSRRRALAHPIVRKIYEQEIATHLAECGSESQVRAFRLIGRAFAADEGEITAKLSLRRAAIERNFRHEIDSMYATRTSRLLTSSTSH